MDAIGFAAPVPAISGAEPCTGSYIAQALPFASFAPSEAEGSMPSEPVSMDAISDSTSPKRLSVTMTSNCFGLRTSCMAQLSASMFSSVTSENFSLCSFATSSYQSTPDFMTLRFSTDMTRLSRLRARSNATSAIRRISPVV